MPQRAREGGAVHKERMDGMPQRAREGGAAMTRTGYPAVHVFLSGDRGINSTITIVEQALMVQTPPQLW